MAHHWGYNKENGPTTWPHHVAPAAKGLHQSPVNIRTSEAVFDKILTAKPLEIRYIPANSKTLFNNGHSVQVLIDGEGSLLEGGPYTHKYRAEQFHFHWGQTSQVGAEHLIDGKTYAAELHIVHWNTELFSSFAEAAKSANGLAVLCIFIQAGSHNPGLKKLVDLLPKVKYANDKTDIPGGFDPTTLLPADKTHYWTYCGSLTTPPCYESVRFLLFKEPIQVSEDQLNAFRQLVAHGKDEKVHSEDEHHGHIVNNFRPTLPLNDRKILASFKA
jgi:carbonic anhydrase